MNRAETLSSLVSSSKIFNSCLKKLDNTQVVLKLFFSIGKCVQYLRSKGHPATHITLVKYIDTGINYYGYIFKLYTGQPLGDPYSKPLKD